MSRTMHFVRSMSLTALSSVTFLTPALAETGNLFVTIPAAAFTVGHGTANHIFADDHLGIPGLFGRTCISNYCVFLASAELPHDSELLGIELNICFEAADDSHTKFFIARVSESTGASEELAMRSFSPGDPGCAYYMATPLSPEPVDQFDNTHLLVVKMGWFWCGGGGFPACPTSHPRFLSVRVYYRAPGGGTVVPIRTSPVAVVPP